MRPRLKPVKGWAFRLILCDSLGRYIYDDVCNPHAIIPLAERLYRLYTKRFDFHEAIQKAMQELRKDKS